MLIQEMKQNCSLILKGESEDKGNLYLGNLNSIEEDNLKAKFIKAVITAARGVNTTIKNVNHYIIEADDDDNFQIIQHFQKSIKFIEQNLKSTNVLVHCFAGVSRSATIVCAYLMKIEKKDSETILIKMKALRHQVNPNEGFRNQLKLFEKKIL
ncbi:unnamed protein product [Paramecium pentaurelia]|uniref:Dual specificity protein phosphatase n=1 Tax=Paramecium pentaurelia TaxID=43138 RepID=A0A8S1S4M1_9CILI|nr:unnamed protein product [Paramecium pentaurelia]